MVLIFQASFEHLKILGIYTRSKDLFNIKNTSILVLFVSFSGMVTTFLLFQTETLSEFGNALYMTSTAYGIIMNFFTFSIAREQLYGVREQFEITIDNRKCVYWGKKCTVRYLSLDSFNSMHFKLNLGMKNDVLKAMYKDRLANVEKWSEILQFALINISLPCIMIPLFVTSFILYLTTDTGSDAFQFPFGIW